MSEYLEIEDIKESGRNEEVVVVFNESRSWPVSSNDGLGQFVQIYG